MINYVLGVVSGIIVGLALAAAGQEPVSKNRLDTIMAACGNNGGVVDATIYIKLATVRCADGATFELGHS